MMIMRVIVVMMMILITCNGDDTNPVYEPCSDTKVKINDGFTFGLAFASKETFFFNQTQLSPCDKRLPLNGNAAAAVALFRPKVDEITLLSVNTSSFKPVCRVFSFLNSFMHFVVVNFLKNVEFGLIELILCVALVFSDQALQRFVSSHTITSRLYSL